MDILNVLLPWLSDHFPQVVGYVIAIFLAGSIAILVYKRVSKIDSLDAAIANLATKADIAVVQGDVSLVKAELSLVQTIVTKIEPSLQDVRERFMRVEDRVETLWKDRYAPAESPRQLNERGKTILHESGVKEIVDDMKSDFLEIVRGHQPTTSYDAERMILEAVADLPKIKPELLSTLKDGAFRTGVDIDAMLLVGGIYLRDLIFSDLGFALTDIDQKTDSPKSTDKNGVASGV